MFPVIPSSMWTTDHLTILTASHCHNTNKNLNIKRVTPKLSFFKEESLLYKGLDVFDLPISLVN